MALNDGADEAALERSYAALVPIDVAVAENMLREAKQIFDRSGVVFFLRQGTCLGAVRDNGLIPWDDDLDLASVIGLHGLTEESIDPVVDSFRREGYFAIVEHSNYAINVSMVKSNIRTDWECNRIIDGGIYQYPGVRIPVELVTQLKEIDFIGEKFMVPNPPEEYLRFKYGADWMTPKKTGYEKDVLDLVPESPMPAQTGQSGSPAAGSIPNSAASRILVLDQPGEPVSGAEVIVTGIGRFRTNEEGYADFELPGDGWYPLMIRYDGHEELLYQEKLAQGGHYVYRPDPSITTERLFILSSE